MDVANSTGTTMRFWEKGRRNFEDRSGIYDGLMGEGRWTFPDKEWERERELQ